MRGLRSMLRESLRRLRASEPSPPRPILQARIAPPSSTASRGMLAAVLLVKDEAHYVDEWLRFHQNVGIEHVYVYDNGLDDAALEVVHDRSPGRSVTVVPFRTATHPRVEVAPGANLQQLAYWHAITNFGASWRWMTFIDSDEFLYPTSADDIRIALASYSDLPGLVAFWSMFGFCGHETPPDGGVIQNFTRRGIFPVGTNTKVIVDPRNVTSITTPHRLGDRLFDEQRRPFDTVDLRPVRGLDGSAPGGPYMPTNEVFRLNHYYTRSKQQFAQKYQQRLDSGTKTPGSTKMLRLAELIERETVEDRSALRFLPGGGASAEG